LEKAGLAKGEEDRAARVAEALRDEAQLRLVIDTIPTAAWTASPDGSNAFVNQRWLDYTGLSREDSFGPGWQAVVHPDDIGKHIDKWREALASGQPLDNEARLRRAADGEYRWFLIRAAPLRDESGNVVRWYGIATDIEDHKRAEQALRRSEAYLADAQRMSRTGSWAFNVANRAVIHASEESRRMYGFDPAAGMPAWDEWVSRLHPEDREGTIAAIERAIRERADLEFEYRVVHPDGTIKHIQNVGHPVLSSLGDVIEVVGTSIDMTERKRAEEAQAALAHVNRVATMGQLTASIAHEVNQPLAGTHTAAQAGLRWLAADPPNLEEVRKALDGIVENARRVGEIIGRIRAFAKKAPPRKERLDVNEAVGEVVALTLGEARKNGIRAQMQLTEHLPLVEGDRVQLQQVMLNLVVNAIEATSEVGDGPRELLITTAQGDRGGVLVAVRDSGPGLNPEHLEHAFDAFYTTKSGGMGMGLAICRSIIESHGGRLWAAPNSPRGAVFQFTVPES
jgi:PAS domain S-box-containing protein